MKKLYTLLFALAFTALAANAQTPRLVPFKSHPVDASFVQESMAGQKLTVKKVAAKAPRRETTLGKKTLSYCNGHYDIALGPNDISRGDSVMGAISFTKKQLAQYVGKTISSLRVPVSQVAGLEAVYGWVASSSQNNVLAIKKMATIEEGYTELTFDEPVEIDGQNTLYFGVSYVLSPDASGDSLACAPSNTDIKSTVGGYYLGIAQRGAATASWVDYHKQGYGVFAVEARVDGVEMSTYDVSVTGLTLVKEDVAVGKTIPAYIDFKNNGANTINNFDVEIYINGNKTQTLNVAPVNPVESDCYGTVDIDPDVALKSEHKGATLGIKVVNLNGQYADDNADDNSAEATFNVYAKLFPHNVLVEEGTGQWCGYCIRGAVAMDAMHNQNLDDFVGVCVHDGYLGDPETVAVDSMAFAINTTTSYEYGDVLGYSSFPLALYDRQYSYDPSYAQTLYEYLREFDSTGKIYGRAYWDGNNIVVSGDVEFGIKSDDGSNYRIQTYLIEDGVGPYYQHNYYSGGSTEMGGYEKMGEWAPVVFNDVLRGVYPEITDVTVLGEQLTTGKISPWDVYQYEYTYEITDEVYRIRVNGNRGTFVSGPRYDNRDNLRLVLVLIDSSNSNAVVNCCKVAISPDKASAISGVEQNDNAPAEYYSINGTRLAQPATKGIYIEKRGNKVTKRIAR